MLIWLIRLTRINRCLELTFQLVYVHYIDIALSSNRDMTETFNRLFSLFVTTAENWVHDSEKINICQKYFISHFN